MEINNFKEFCEELIKVGFSMGSDNGEGIFTLCNYFGKGIEWHTSNLETDPWQWRIRAIKERSDIVYSKVFLKKGGWITKEWYPYFLTIRRQGKSLEEMYEDGLISEWERKVYQIICDHKEVALHDIKSLSGCSKEEASKLEGAVNSLQMKLFITMCGETQKISKAGQPFGWPVTVFCTAEHFWGEEFISNAFLIKKEEAVERITAQIYKLNPNAKEKDIKRFMNK